MGETKEERITVVKTGGDKAVYKDRRGVGGEGGAKAIDIAEVKVGGPSDVVDVGME